MIIIYAIATSACLSKLFNGKMEKIIPGMLSVMLVIEYGMRRLRLFEYYDLFKILAAIISIAVLIIARRDIRLVIGELISSPAVVTWIVASVSLRFYYFYNAECVRLFDKNIIIMGLMLIMMGATRWGKYKSLIIGAIVAIAIYLTAIENEFISDNRFVLAGLVISCFLFSIYKYFTCKDIAYLFVACLHFGAVFTTGRMSILLLAALLIAALSVYLIDIMDNKILMRYSAKGLVLSIVLCFGMVITAISSNLMIGDDIFRKDVLFTYLDSVFTIRRYSFDLVIHIPVSYFLILSILAFVIVGIYSNKKQTNMFLVMNVGIIAYVIALGVLYVGIMAYHNFQNGEYLTGFEQYIQMPVVMVLLFWGCYINGFFEEGMNS